MKKAATLLLLITIVLITVGCPPSHRKDKAKEDITFIYQAAGMITYKKVTITQDTVITANDRDESNEITTALEENSWKELMNELQKIDVNTLNELKAPSTGYTYDAALGATLTIKKDGVNYTSTMFDHGNPPQAIKGLVNSIIKASALEMR